MSKTVILKQLIDGVQVQTSIVVGTSTVRIRHLPGVRYTLDALDGSAPTKIKGKRLGSEVQIHFYENPADSIEQQPDLVIEELSHAEDLDLYGTLPDGAVERYAYFSSSETLGQWAVGDSLQVLTASKPALGLQAGFLAPMAGLSIAGAAGAAGGRGDGTATAPLDVVPLTTLSLVTNDDGTLTATGTTRSGAMVRLVWPSGDISTHVADANGQWSALSQESQPNGTLTAAVVDSNGNTLSQTTSAFTDTIPPQVSFDPVVQNPDGTLTASGTGEPGSTVTLKDKDGNAVGSATVASVGSWTITTAGPVPAGDVRVTITDINGNSTDSPTQTFTDTTPPLTSVLSSVNDNAGNATGPILSGGATDDTTPTFSGTTEPNNTVRLFNGSTLLGSTVADSQGIWSFTPETALAEGQYSITVTATSASGIDSSPSPQFELVVDTTRPGYNADGTPASDVAPTVTIAEAAAGVDLFEADDGIQTVVTLPTGTVQGDRIILTVTGPGNVTQTVTYTVTADDVAASMAEITIGADRLAGAGVYTVTATVTDAAGNTSDASQTSSFTFSTTVAAPAVAITDAGWSALDGITNNNSVSISGLLPDASWRYSTDGGGSWTDGSGTSFTLPDGDYAPGSVLVRQVITNNLGTFLSSPTPLVWNSERLASVRADGFQGDSKVVGLQDGSTLVVYQDLTQGGWVVAGLRLGADGLPMGQPLVIATNAFFPDVTATANGALVVFQDANRQNEVGAVFVQANGDLSSVIPVSQTAPINGAASHIQVTTLTDGRFALAWVTANSNEPTTLWGAVMDSQGNVVVPETALLSGVDLLGDSMNREMDLAAGPDGGLFFAWTGRDNSNGGVFFQRFDSDLTPHSATPAPVQVNVAENAMQSHPAISTRPDGTVVIAWLTYEGIEGTNLAQMLRIFNADGTARTGALTATDLAQLVAGGWERYGDIVFLNNGTIAMIWPIFNADTWTYNVMGRLFDGSDGMPLGDTFAVSTYAVTGKWRWFASADATTDGGFQVSWSSWDQDGSDYGVYTQRFDAQGNKVGHLRVDTSTDVPSLLAVNNGANDGTVAVTAEAGSRVTVTFSANGVSESVMMVGAGNNVPIEVTLSSAQRQALGSGSFPVTVTVSLMDAAGNSETSEDITVDLTVAPIVLDLNGDGHLGYTQLLMDVNLDGHMDRTAWVVPEDGVLVWDKFRDGSIRDLDQYAFTLFGGRTDLEGLRLGFDSNQDGVFDANDALFAQFAVWQDLNGDGAVGDEELRSLLEWGIARIALDSDGVQRTPAEGVLEHGRFQVTRTDGSDMLAADAAFVFHTVMQAPASADTLYPL